jgi:hypothetical protein
MTTSNQHKLSIFRYSREKHCFLSSDLCLTDGDEKPSLDWQKDHDAWLQSCGNQPAFDNIRDLQSFNQMGADLTTRLQRELPNADVEPFQPVYDQMRVSCGWWHLRDDKYGFPVSVQKLPVSDQLKADFSMWRHKKDDHCLADVELRRQMEEEGAALQERLYRELHQVDEKGKEEEIGRNSSHSFSGVKQTTRRLSW